MDNPLSGLKIDAWYKGVIVIAAAALIASLAFDRRGIPIPATGFLFVGFGEWVNHPTRSGITQPSAWMPVMKVTSTARDASAFGVFLDVIGVGLIGLGIYRLL